MRYCSIKICPATELSLRLAEELGITTVGFIRNKSLNIYTNPERITGLEL